MLLCFPSPAAPSPSEVWYTQPSRNRGPTPAAAPQPRAPRSSGPAATPTQKGTPMAGAPNGKLRILYIMRMLTDETDASRGLSMTDIIGRLADLGMTADRKTVYTDLKMLREFGMDIGTAQRNPVEYYLRQRLFTMDELMLMADAVQSCRFMTQAQADRICKNLESLAVSGERKKLRNYIHVDDRARGRNSAVLANVDLIHEAMRNKRRITYTYWKTGLDGKPKKQHAGKAAETYEVTPLHVTFSENNYYLTAFSEQHQENREYRVDRMQDLAVSEERARGPKVTGGASAQETDAECFGRHKGPEVAVTFECTEDGAGIVADRFGKRASFTRTDAGTCRAKAKVQKSNHFFGWVASMSGAVKIAKPQWMADEYAAYLRGLVGE